MTAWLVLGALAASGCHLVFGADTNQPPAPDPRVCPAAADPAQDPDGDGIINLNDNCPDVRNPDQSDEDADCAGDSCDLCPWVADTPDVNPDGDRFGEGCDYNNAQANATTFFDNFADPGFTSTNWLAGGPVAWTVDGGRYASGGPGIQYAAYKFAQPRADIDTTFEIDPQALAGTDDFIVGAEVLMGAENPAQTAYGYIVGVARDANGTWLRIMKVAGAARVNEAQIALLDDELAPISIAGPLRLHVNATSTKVDATLWVGGRELSTTTTTSFVFTSPRHGIASIGAPATFLYFGFVL